MTILTIAVLAGMSAEVQFAYTTVGLIAVSAAVLGIAWRGLVSVFRVIKRANETIDALQDIIKEWNGEPPMNGDPGRPSYPVRLANVERALAGLVAVPRPRSAPRRGTQ